MLIRGNTVLVSSHINNLIKLDRVNRANVKELQDLYEKIESNVRALKTVRINQKQGGPLLIPIVLEKLLNVKRLQISRKLVKENCSIDDFLICINTKMTVRESYEFTKHDIHEGTPYKSSFSRSALFANSNLKNVLFCQSVDHYNNKLYCNQNQ